MGESSPYQKKIIASARVAHLATADSNAVPHVIPICFAYDGSFFYSAIDQKPKRTYGMNLKRTRNILSNPQVALILDHYEEEWSQLWYVLIKGQGELLQSGQEHRTAIELLRQKYPQYRTMDIEGNPVIKIKPTAIVSWGTPKSCPGGKLNETPVG